MSAYMTEEEQIELIKRWWRKNSAWISILLSIILLSFSLYKYWQWHHQKILTQASVAYEQLMGAVSQHETAKVKVYAKALVDNYKNTAYADAARLMLAKQFVTEGALSDAKAMLTVAIQSTKINALKDVARLRLARILLEEKKYDAALSMLDLVKDKTYSALVDEMKGDVYAATGRHELAFTAYKKAIKATQVQGVANLYLEMKLNELGLLNAPKAGEKV